MMNCATCERNLSALTDRRWMVDVRLDLEG